MLYRDAIVAPLLKQALAEALAELPWFAGRLALREDRRTFDVACTNAGAQLVVTSSSNTVSQVAEALGARPYSDTYLLNPWKEYFLPRDPHIIAREQLPLASVMLMHLSGGGGLLAVTAYHGIADFETLQTFVAHLAAAYNAALKRRDGDGPTAAADTAGGRGSGLTQPPPNRVGAFFGPTTLEDLTDPGPLPPGLAERESTVAVPNWKVPYILFKILYNLHLSGGGVEGRNIHVSAQRCAALKQQASLELAAERAAEDGGGELRDVQWVSTKDALAGRLAQVLHSLPLRRGRPMAFMTAANMRPRVEPPLPASQLGNMVFAARVDGARPAEDSLGRLAGRLRLAITRHAAAQFWCFAHKLSSLASSPAGKKAQMLVPEFIIDPDPYKCLLAPQGPYLMSNWDIQHDLWQFGPEPPLAMCPAVVDIGPNVVLLYPHARDGVNLFLALHRVTWRHLDAVTRGDLSAAF